MATIQSGMGRITLFEDFLGPEWIVAETAASGSIGPFRVIGDGIAETDAGITIDEATVPLSGVALLITSGDDNHATGLSTSKFCEIGKMGTLVAECRVQFADVLTKAFVFGLTNENQDDISIEDEIVSIATDTLTISADDFVGFFFDAEASSHTDDWLALYKGGTVTAPTLGSSIDLDAPITDGEWQVLRFEIDPDGTARWYVDGKLLKTLAGACSTTEDLAVVCLLGDHGAVENAYLDYIHVSANRDWTV